MQARRQQRPQGGLWIEPGVGRLRVPGDRLPIFSAKYADEVTRNESYIVSVGYFVTDTKTFLEWISPAFTRLPWSVAVSEWDGNNEDSDLLVDIRRFYQPEKPTFDDGTKTIFLLEFRQIYWGKERRTMNLHPVAPELEPVVRPQ